MTLTREKKIPAAATIAAATATTASRIGPPVCGRLLCQTDGDGRPCVAAQSVTIMNRLRKSGNASALNRLHSHGFTASAQVF